MWDKIKTIRLYQADEQQNSYENGFYSVEAFSVRGTAERQEDCIACILNERSVILVVCDGMGGMSRGDLASKKAVEEIKSLAEQMNWETRPKEFLRQVIVQADEAVNLLGNSIEARKGCGSTLVIVLLVENKMYWANVGDSRAYFFRKEEMVQITVDHNYGERLIRQLTYGEITKEEYKREYPKAAALTSYLGIGGVREYYICEESFPLEKGDIVMVQSDGLYKLMTDEEMRNQILTCGLDLKLVGENMLRQAEKNRKNYQDNTSIILARMK